MSFNKHLILSKIIFVLIATALLVACGSPAESKEPGSGAVEAPSLETAQVLVDKGNCATCHTIPGIEGAAATLGPEWCDPAHEFQGGEVDLTFLSEAITDPNAEIASGFAANIMPANFGNLYTQEEIETLARFIATLKCEE